MGQSPLSSAYRQVCHLGNVYWPNIYVAYLIALQDWRVYKDIQLCSEIPSHYPKPGIICIQGKAKPHMTETTRDNYFMGMEPTASQVIRISTVQPVLIVMNLTSTHQLILASWLCVSWVGQCDPHKRVCPLQLLYFFFLSFFKGWPNLCHSSS